VLAKVHVLTRLDPKELPSAVAFCLVVIFPRDGVMFRGIMTLHRTSEVLTAQR